MLEGEFCNTFIAKVTIMNAAHVHLLFNHLPIVGGIIGTLILIAGFLLKNNSVVKQTALGVFIFSAITALPAFFSGEGAEEVVESIAGISHNTIETHEDIGKLFLILIIGLGVLSAVTLFATLRKHQASRLLYIVVLVVGLAGCVVAQRVGTSGGEIRHTEIGSGALNGGNGVEANDNEHDEH